jgi:hypothetical protein
MNPLQGEAGMSLARVKDPISPITWNLLTAYRFLGSFST